MLSMSSDSSDVVERRRNRQKRENNDLEAAARTDSAVEKQAEPRERKKSSSGKKKKTDPQQDAYKIINRMREIYAKDAELLAARRPGLNRLENVDEVCNRILRRETQDACVELGILDEIRIWLEPHRDGSLPNQKIKRALLDVLRHLRVRRSDLVRSGVGKIVHFYTKNPQETKEIRGMAHELMGRWKRVIIQEEQEE